MEERCPYCGVTLEEVKNQYKVGCAFCYTYFSDKGGKLESILRGIHGKYTYKEPIPSHSQENFTEEDFRLELTIRDLEERMKELVAEENYEEAAAVRDELKKLQEERTRRLEVGR